MNCIYDYFIKINSITYTFYSHLLAFHENGCANVSDVPGHLGNNNYCQISTAHMTVKTNPVI